MSGPAVDADELYRFFRSGEEQVRALRGVSVRVEAGELVVVAGPSGSGKSTLLACVSGMEDPDGGTVRIGGERLTARPERMRARIRAARIGVMRQSGNLHDHLTVAQNLQLARRLARQAPIDVMAELEPVGLAGKAGAVPTDLSGGEVARAALAVAVVTAPPVLLADEPTGELDSATEATVLELIRAQADRGAAVLIASHSAAVAAAADRLVRLQDGRVLP